MAKKATPSPKEAKTPVPIRTNKEEFLDEATEHDESSDEVKKKMGTGEEEADVYSEEGREELVEADEVADWEEGFAKGAEGKGHSGKCACCGKVLSQEPDEVVERKYKGEVMEFCSDKCATTGPRMKK